MGVLFIYCGRMRKICCAAKDFSMRQKSWTGKTPEELQEIGGHAVTMTNHTRRSVRANAARMPLLRENRSPHNRRPVSPAASASTSGNDYAQSASSD